MIGRGLLHDEIIEKLGEGGIGVFRELVGDPSRTWYGLSGSCATQC